jgi:hypothetical protein
MNSCRPQLLCRECGSATADLVWQAPRKISGDDERGLVVLELSQALALALALALHSRSIPLTCTVPSTSTWVPSTAHLSLEPSSICFKGHMSHGSSWRSSTAPSSAQSRICYSYVSSLPCLPYPAPGLTCTTGPAPLAHAI